MIAEKPKVAYKIARALGTPRKYMTGWVVGSIKVLPAAGHLYNLQSPSRTYPVFDYHWVLDRKKSSLASAFGKLPSDEVVIACDYDIEGSLIGYNVVRYALRFKPTTISRMKFSSMVLSELRQAFYNRGDVDMENVLAGEARHEVDYLFGINLSRFLIDAAGKVLSAGRVQIPTLGLVIKRENERESFQSRVFYVVEALVDGYVFTHPKKFSSNGEAKAHMPEANGVIHVEKTKKRIRPPPPYNLSDLQKDAAKLGFSPSQTLRIAQNLYEMGLISYPRTTSRKYPVGLPVKQIADRFADYAAPITHPLRAVEGKGEGPHPCIYPTGKRARLSKTQFKIFDLIVRRFLASLSEDAEIWDRTLILRAGEEYIAQDKILIKKGWYQLYKWDKKPLPFQGGESVCVEGKVKRKKTQPPPLYTKITLLEAMEKMGLGTKATRGEIIEKIFTRGYVEGRKIKSTTLGRKIINILERFVPEITSEEMTVELERELESIQERPSLKPHVVKKAKKRVAQVMDQLIENKDAIAQAFRSL